MPKTSATPAISKVEHFPIAFFAMIMGMTGLTLAWEKAVLVLGAPALASQILLIFSACLLLIVVLVYLVKIVTRTQSVIAEFNHPIKMSFFPAFSISLLLMSIATLSVSEALSLNLWFAGAALHLLFTLNALSQWIHHPKFQIAHSTPAWFIPVVGNILVPIAGVEHGFIELSWFFFSIGLVFWIILKTLIFNRIIFHEPLPEKLLPILFILIAPPAVGFISYMKLNGELDNFARILFYCAMFILLLLVSQFARFARIKFFLSWWAYSFPLAASTIAAQLMYLATSEATFRYLSMLLLAITTLVITMLLIRTLLGIIRNQICVPE